MLKENFYPSLYINVFDFTHFFLQILVGDVSWSLLSSQKCSNHFVDIWKCSFNFSDLILSHLFYFDVTFCFKEALVNYQNRIEFYHNSEINVETYVGIFLLSNINRFLVIVSLLKEKQIHIINFIFNENNFKRVNEC